MVCKKNHLESKELRSVSISQLYGFDIYKNWQSPLPISMLSIEKNTPKKIFISEVRIDQLAKRLNLEGMRILDLGCLEGASTLVLKKAGAKEIIAIEGRIDNFLKCLIVKNAFELENCKFLFGDINKILSFLSETFDLCLAIGILYHFENPISLIYRISQLANNLFVWTHYSTKDYPSEVREEKIEYQGCIYRGKYVREDTEYPLAGLQNRSFWITEEDIFKVIKDAGFKNIGLISKEQHEHGPAITFLAQK